jgi:transcriptional regulator with GAF, ATPase, and Fis domain
MRHSGEPELIGTSQALIDLKQEIEQVAQSDAKVLITGESGVGKELVARSVQSRSPRAQRPFVAVNCAAMSESLLESELFGHVKGSFTGAYRDKPGKLEQADKGTMFLDEIGEMTLRMQGLLLRFLETGELQKVGADHTVGRVDVRVIAATNRNLRDLVAEGTFREDLFYRINVIHLTVPSLRDRKEDIPLLIAHFLESFAENDAHNTVKGIAPDAFALLCKYPWPGNVRELENVIERLVVTGRHELARVEDLPPEVRAHQNTVPVRPKRERRRTVADNLFKKLTEDGESFWTAVYPMYMQRDLSSGDLRDLVRKGLEAAGGNYRVVARIFNMPEGDYKKFLSFLRKHKCQVPFKDYR